ncbi:hypothetical protein CEXT_664621 [Caerostris extrusa]|uniref:Uncharacterized protein n=1 Tax=Caerostris extrusa TaxID=172846 RepID=A0AAV4PZU2_CAEEX|nr:hypothetical protein CEXT_664621 [Caerostris extrusa]
MEVNASGVGRQQRSKSLPATYFRTVSNGGLWQMPSEPMPEPVDLISTDSPLQKKRWWRRLSSARSADSADRGRSVSFVQQCTEPGIQPRIGRIRPGTDRMEGTLRQLSPSYHQTHETTNDQLRRGIHT